MSVVAIDPGYTQSAIVVLEDNRPVYALLDHNDFVLSWLRSAAFSGPLVIEQIQSYGMAAGKTLFETCVWSGRFWQVWADRGMEVHQLPRREVKLHLCGQPRAKDPNIRQALIDRYGPGKDAAIGLKKSPGPLYGFKSDMWAALAVAVTWWDLNNQPENVTSLASRRTA